MNRIMKKRVMKKNRDARSASKGFEYLVLGAALGAVVTLMCAPRPGSELRRDVAVATRIVSSYTSDAARRAGDRASSAYEKASQQAVEIYDRAVEQAQKLFGAGLGHL